MLGTIVNALGIVLGGLIGLFMHKALSESLSTTILQGVGLVCALIGLQMAIGTPSILLVLISVVIGGVLGERISIHDHLESFGKRLEQRFAGHRISAGFVTGTILYCSGSMSILGSLKSGLEGVHDILYLKAIIDFVISIILGASLGVGIVLSAVSVFLYQGAITLFARFISPYMTPEIISDLTAVGGIVLLTIAVNFFVPNKVKTANFLPALLVPVVYHLLKALFL